MADRVHELKCWPSFFAAILDGSKTFEVRKNDRDFAVGDVLKLREWDPGMPSSRFMLSGGLEFGEYTKRDCMRRVTYVLRGGEFGIEAGVVVMGLAAMGEPAKAEAEARRATLEEVSELLWTMRKSKPVATPVRDALSEARDAVMRLIGAPMPPDPCDAELTKLRAVADAAEKFIGLVRIGFDPLKGDARKLLADMEHDLAGWRTKEGGR